MTIKEKLLIRHTCPIAGCGRDLPVPSAREAHSVMLCPCEKRQALCVGMSLLNEWTFREQKYSQEERQEHNAIVQSLILGHTTGSKRLSRVNTTPDATSANMVDAERARIHAASEMERFILEGNLERARIAAERHRACFVSLQHNMAQYRNRRRREVDKRGLWQHGGTFVVHIDGVRFTFPFEAMWSEDGTSLSMLNAAELEAAAGLEVGADGWRQLIDLLRYTELAEKPGREVDVKHLIWREHKGHLELREYIKKKFPRALLAIEALRRQLLPELHDETESLSSEERHERGELEALPSIQEYNADVLKLEKTLPVPGAGQPRPRRKSSSFQ